MNCKNKRSVGRRLSTLAVCGALILSTVLGTGAASAATSSKTSDPHKKDLLLWLGFNEGKGTTVSDSSRHIADAQVHYGFTDAAFMENQDPQWRDKGVEGGCLLFDGCTTYVEYPNNALRVSGDALTVSAWVAPRAFNWNGPDDAANKTDRLTAIVDQADRGGKKGFVLGYQNHGALSFQVGTGDSWLTIWSNGDNLNTYAWNYVTATFDARAKEMVLYLNGERVASRSLPAGAAIVPSDAPLMVGRNGSAGQDVEGTLKFVPSGYLDEVKLYRCALTKVEVANVYQSAAPSEIVFEELWLQNILTGDYTRPQYHAAPYQFWMNEPHAPIYYNGMYHLFFQEDMAGPYWELIYWGHFVSPDMVNWKPVKEAITSTEDSVVPDGVWSGGSTWDKNGVPLLFFTAGNDSYSKVEGLVSNQNIGVAYPKDLSDPELTEWEIYDELAVIQKPGEGRLKEFRDPSIWREGDTWYMVLCSGSTTSVGGSALLYTTDRLELRSDGTIDMDWQYKGVVYEMPHQPTLYGATWELPIILPLTNKAKTISKYLFIISPAGAGSDNKIFYWIGSFDKESGKFTPDASFGDTPRLLDYGCNVFTGPSAFKDPVSGDVVMFSIMQDQRSTLDRGISGWAHTAGLARKLWLTDDGSDVKLAPIEAIEALEEKILVDEKNISMASANQKLASVKGDMLHIQVTADVSKSAQFGIDLKKGGWMDCTSYTYYTASQTIQGWTKNKASGASAQTVSGPLSCKDGILEMDIYVDRSLVEAFFNKDKAITTRAYTVDPNSQSVSLFAQGSVKILSLRVAAMGSIFD